jgi:hypothetical protein
MTDNHTGPAFAAAPASSPTPGLTPFDAGNPLLSVVDAHWTVSPAHTPLGQRLIITLRTASTSMTIFIDREAALQLAQHIGSEAARLSPLIVPGTTLG